MFEKIRERFTREETIIPKEVIVPAEGDENRYSLPERGPDGKPLKPHDDWIKTGEHATDNDTISVDLARYLEDGSIERRTELPARLFEKFQADRKLEIEAEQRFKLAKQDLGISAVRQSIVNMVKSSQAYADWEPIEAAALQQIDKARNERVDHSWHAIDEYSRKKHEQKHAA